MEKFTYEGNEPEEKARLWYLFHNQRTSISVLAPRPDAWNAWTAECIERKDWPGLCRIINQRGRGDMMPVVYGGYNHEKNFHCMMEGFGGFFGKEKVRPAGKSHDRFSVISDKLRYVEGQQGSAGCV